VGRFSKTARYRRCSGGRAPALALAAAFAATLSAALPGPALATTASVALNAGGASFINSTPAATVTFPATTLNGTAQSVSATLALDVGDASGSGAGWDVTATSTSFTSGSDSLPSSATTIQSAPSVSCDAGATGCTPASTTVNYPYTLPAGASAPTATKLFNATAGTGMGDQTFTPTWTLAIPADAVASGTAYTSIWTFSLVSGP
jgi:hypothetical protein